MTGLPKYNFPLFDAVSADLRAQGWVIISPAETDHEKTRAAALASPDGRGADAYESWGSCLARDVRMLADGLPPDDIDADGNEVTDGKTLVIDGIALLPGWERSKGARLEAFVGLLTDKVYFVVEENTEQHVSSDRYTLVHRDSEWVEHMLASTWRGVRVHRTGADD